MGGAPLLQLPSSMAEMSVEQAYQLLHWDVQLTTVRNSDDAFR